VSDGETDGLERLSTSPDSQIAPAKSSDKAARNTFQRGETWRDELDTW
jgi:hypothetical protein